MVVPLNGRDANLDRQDGLEEVPLLDAVFVDIAIEYLEGGYQDAQQLLFSLIFFFHFEQYLYSKEAIISIPEFDQVDLSRQ